MNKKNTTGKNWLDRLRRLWQRVLPRREKWALQPVYRPRRNGPPFS